MSKDKYRLVDYVSKVIKNGDIVYTNQDGIPVKAVFRIGEGSNEKKNTITLEDIKSADQ